jgi:hypothetical protein
MREDLLLFVDGAEDLSIFPRLLQDAPHKLDGDYDSKIDMINTYQCKNVFEKF